MSPRSEVVTLLFTDIEGSTRRWERHTSAMAEAISRHDVMLRQAIELHGGRVFKTIGDAFCAAFAQPANALNAALVIQQAVADGDWSDVGGIRVRIALHTGEAEARDDDYFGPTVNRVARLLATGHGGQVLLSRATANLVQGRLPAGTDLRDLGGHRLKDLARPEHVFQLTGRHIPDEFPPLKSLDARPNNLPTQATALIGREQELASALAALRVRETRLLTLTGAGGTGKTRLALQVAAELGEEFTDGIWFVDLSPLTDPGLVLNEIARAAGVREEGERSIAGRLVEAFRDERILLVLDNVEHVISAARDVADVVAACPGLTVLATSRAPLRIRGEREQFVPPLSFPDRSARRSTDAMMETPSIRLFVERAIAARPDFALSDEHVQAVAAICERLDGLPLAIELAATRVRALSPPALLSRLDQRLPQLTRGSRDLPTRQQTMRDAIAWSHDLLDPTSQIVFRRLAVFAGGWTLAAAEAVARWPGSDHDVIEATEELVDQSLVRREDDGEGEARFRMLETVREFARDRLEQSGDAPDLERRHAVWSMAFAEEISRRLSGASQAEGLRAVDAELDNLRIAMDRSRAIGDGETALRIATALNRFWWLRAHLREGRERLEQGLRDPGEAPPKTLADAWRGAGWLASLLGDREAALAAYESSVAISRGAGLTGQLANGTNVLGTVHFDLGDVARAKTCFHEALELFRAMDHPAGMASALTNLGEVARQEGDRVHARALHGEALALQRRSGDRSGAAISLHELGQVAHELGELDTAWDLFVEARTLYDETGNRWAASHVLHDLGCLARDRGDLTTAADLLGQALVRRHELGERPAIAESLAAVASVAARAGQAALAARLADAASAQTRPDSIELQHASADRGVESAEPGDSIEAGRPADARELIGEAIRFCAQLAAAEGRA